MQKVVLITGASSGIGFSTARALTQRGFRVYAAARRLALMEPLRADGVTPLALDVADHASILQAVGQVMQAEGRIDVLINNAGFGYFGPVEAVPLEEARRQLEVNVFGLADLCREVVPIMRRQGSGRIVNTSSIAGRLVLMYGGWYHVSKYSVEALSDALRMELQPFGIRVSMVEPGGIRTDWGLIAADHLRRCTADTPYAPTATHEADLLQRAYTSNALSAPEVVSRAIVRAVCSRRPRARYRIGRFSHLAVATHRLLPARAWDALMRRIAAL